MAAVAVNIRECEDGLGVGGNLADATLQSTQRERRRHMVARYDMRVALTVLAHCQIYFNPTQLGTRSTFLPS